MSGYMILSPSVSSVGVVPVRREVGRGCKRVLEAVDRDDSVGRVTGADAEGGIGRRHKINVKTPDKTS